MFTEKEALKIFYLNQLQVFRGPQLHRLLYPAVQTLPEPTYPECFQSKKHTFPLRLQPSTLSRKVAAEE